MPARTKPASTRGKRVAKKEAEQVIDKGKDEVQVAQNEQQPEQEEEAHGVGTKRGARTAADEKAEREPPAKKPKTDEEPKNKGEAAKEKAGIDIDHPAQHMYQTGTIERGHIYFFYRPKVQLEEVHSVDDVQRFYILLVPRPPEFSQGTDAKSSRDANVDDEGEMTILSAGADAVPAAGTTDEKKKRFRLLAVGKKSLPDPEAGGGKGRGRKGVFWAMVTTFGEDLQKLQEGLGEKEYETKTRGHRHQGPARLAARGAYAIVNTEARTPSQRETHLGYHLSHPSPSDFGDVQKALGIHLASSFVVQVKNPNAPNTGGVRVGLPGGRRAKFPDRMMREVFGAREKGAGEGGGRGRESYGLRFASVERGEMLDYEGAELLLIAARAGEEGLETSLGEGRGEALAEAENAESEHSIDTVLKELAMDAGKISAQPLEGNWT